MILPKRTETKAKYVICPKDRIIQYNFYVPKTYQHINLLKLINKQINSAIYCISTVTTQHMQRPYVLVQLGYIWRQYHSLLA